MKIVTAFAALALVMSAGSVYAQSNMTGPAMSTGMTKAHSAKMKSAKPMKKSAMHSSMSGSNMTGNMTSNSH